MPSLTIELDEKVLSAVEAAAVREGHTVSDWAREHLAKACREPADWPEGYFDTIASFGKTQIQEPPEFETPLDEIAL